MHGCHPSPGYTWATPSVLGLSGEEAGLVQQNPTPQEPTPLQAELTIQNLLCALP
jgi:hypothetical protein